MDEGQGVLNLPVKVSCEAKLKELLHRITSVEIKLCSDATKEFVKILKGDDGGELLRQYVRASPKCSELLDAWKLRQGKEGMSYIFELIANLLSHYEGKYKSNDAELIAISRDLDKFSRLLVVEYLGDVYKELNSKEAKRQKAALLLMASIVRRGPSLASEVSKCFDFKLAEFTKLAEQKRKQNEKRIKNSLRKLYVGFALSFLEVGKPGLLRWVLQQKEMYSGVLRWLGNDDDETVIYVLSTLRDRVLVEEALVPPALRSVLFGNVTLEQLINISGRECGGPTAELAYNILVLVCTDPCNGLMPDLTKRPIPLRGNTKRIMGLMKKLHATEIQYHKDLLLAIVNGRPSFGLSYLEEYPYNTEDCMSPSWFAAVSLAASLVSLIGNGLSREFINSQSNDLHIFGNMDVQSVMKCMFPRPFSSAVNCRSSSTNQSIQHIVSIKQEIQNDVQALLPDPQVLLTLLSSLDSCSKTHDLCLKRTGSHLEHRSRRNKMFKMDAAERDIDIVVGGISSVSDVPLSGNEVSVSDARRADVSDDEEDLIRTVREIWGVGKCSMMITTPKEAEIYLHSKLLDALKYFHRIMPYALGGSFEFFVGLLNNPLELTVDLLVSILSLLMEYIEWHPNNEMPLRTPPILYKHLQSFIKLFIFSTADNVRHGAYKLAKAAMFSTGAFDSNLHEIEAWLLFLPGYHRNKSSVNSLDVEVLHGLCPIVISFLCDAVSTVGNNLVKYWDLLKSYVHSSEGVGDLSLDFSPLMICVLEKCLRLIRSTSGTYSLPEKSMVLIYMCNTVKFLLQTQVDAELLSAVLNKQLTERLVGCDENEEVLCEWKPLKNFWLFVQSMSQQHGGCHFSCNERSFPSNSSFTSTLGEVERLLSNGGVGEMPRTAIAFISSILCVGVDEILMNMPKLVIISHNMQKLPLSFLSSVFFLDHSALFHAFELWPQMFCAGLDMAVSDLSGGSDNAAPAGINCNQVFDTTNADAVAFSLFLKQVPFHLLFPATMCVNGPYSSDLSKMGELLLDKLSECTSDCSLLNLRLVLHWTHRIQSYHNLNPSVEIEQLSNICVVLARKLLAQLLVSECSSDFAAGSGSCSLTHKIHEVAKITFTHPSVLMSLSLPLGSVQNFASNIENSFDGLNILFGEEVRNSCSPIVNILTMTLDYVWSISSTHFSASEARDLTYKELVVLFKSLQHRLFLEVKDRFNQSVFTKNLTHVIQTFYTLHALVRFLSPFLLLELVDWMFSRVELDDFAAKNTAFSVGCSLAAGAFSALSHYLQQQTRDMVPYDIFWEINEKNIKAHLFEKIYSKVVNFAISFQIDCADKCLLEAFSSTIHSTCKLSHSSSSDYYLKPVSSILKCLVFPSLDHYESDRPHDEKSAELSSGRLEIIKLLRILLLKNAHQSESDSGNDSAINYKELHSLLCHSYGATLSQIDLDIWKLIQEIEYINKSACESIVNAECLWGTAALKAKSDHPMEQYTSHIKVGSQDTTEWYTSQLRENIPVDPDICTSTVLFFPYDRSTNDELLFVTKIRPDDVGERVEIYSSNVQVRKQYDPSFILRFSIHILAKDIVEPVDFALLRLLAIAFVSMSSPDLGIRKLAYETLGMFKNALEKCQKRKDIVGLRLLLTTVQNSIEEPWQRIPSVFALFAAEASCILLDSSLNHFAAISTLLIHSSKLNLQVIPLFDDFLWSTSVNFKEERLWMLRLVYAGLNSDDDVMLYIRNSVFESLMSFYMSPLSDFESKELVIEVIQKSVKLRKSACHLVKHCSLFSWFSSLISVTGERFNGVKERYFLKQVLAILMVVNDAISCGSILKWLRNFALEQLAELSSNIFNYLLHDATLMNEAVALLNPLLQMIVSVSKISQKRKICQPHFTLSNEGLFKIYQVVGQFNHMHVNPELALEAILMNAPPVSIFLMSKERLESFLMWAISSALQSESSQKLMPNVSRVDSIKESEVPHKNSLMSKFLRWLTACVIIGKLYQKSDYMDTKFVESQNFISLHSLLRHTENISGQRNEIRSAGEELLASTIFYLQLLLGVNCEVLPSVVSALCLLLFNASNSQVGKTELLLDYDPLISSLCSRILCPPEANPAWRWSFYQPWKDPSLEQTDAQMMEQYHACQSLLLIISNVLSGRKGVRSGEAIGGCRNTGQPVGLSSSVWPTLLLVKQQQQVGSGTRAVFLENPTGKRECAVTGVFLPHRGDNPSKS
ncbi:hypothetical protein K1719_033585 [Acacia pycnantha]|nr:hypothetical protein K1719_033585 [Acacia pycnantha]